MAKIIRRYRTNKKASVLPWVAAGGLAYLLLKPKKESILVGIGQVPSDFRTELPEEGAPPVTTTTVRIGGEIRTFTGRELTADEYPDAKKIIDGYFAAGKHLTKWRNSVMAIRDLAYVHWPEFARYELPKYAPAMSATDLNKILRQGEWITLLYEEASSQYGLAQQEYDALMIEVDAIKQELAAAGISGLGDPGIGLLILLAIAIVALATTGVATLHYAGILDITSRLDKKMKLAASEQEALVRSQEQYVEEVKAIGNLAEKLSQEKREQFILNSYPQAVANQEKRTTSIQAAAQQIPVVLAAADKSEKAAEEASKIKLPDIGFDWLEALPYVGLALIGIIIAPSIRDVISSRAKKQ